RRQAQRGTAAALAVDRLLCRAAQTVLVARRHQREACRRAHRRVGVALRELEALCGEAVEHGRDGAKHGITPAIAAEISVAEIISHDEDDIGLFHQALLSVFSRLSCWWSG